MDKELANMGNGHLTSVARSAPSARRGRPRGKFTSRDVAFEILAKMKTPMALKDLAQAVLASGKFTSKSPAFAQNLGVAMQSDKRFRKVGRGVQDLLRGYGALQ